MRSFIWGLRRSTCEVIAKQADICYTILSSQIKKGLQSRGSCNPNAYLLNAQEKGEENDSAKPLSGQPGAAFAFCTPGPLRERRATGVPTPTAMVIEGVNSSVHSIRGVEDSLSWGSKEYWSCAMLSIQSVMLRWTNVENN